MQEDRQFTGNTKDELWPQLELDLAQTPDLSTYRAVLHQQGRAVVLNIDIDMGGGFEGGSETTTLSAAFHNPESFRFSLHREHFLDELGKLLGMQDIETGYPEFDPKVVVKSSDQERVRSLLADEPLRAILVNLDDFLFEIVLPHHSGIDSGASQLVLTVDEGVLESERLRPLYSAFFRVLQAIDQTEQ